MAFQYHSVVNKSNRITFNARLISQGARSPNLVFTCKWIFLFHCYSDGHNAKNGVIAFWILPYYWVTHWSRGLNRDTGKYRIRLRARVRSMSRGLGRARHISRAIDMYKQSSQSQHTYLSSTVPCLFFISGNRVSWHRNFYSLLPPFCYVAELNSQTSLRWNSLQNRAEFFLSASKVLINSL